MNDNHKIVQCTYVCNIGIVWWGTIQNYSNGFTEAAHCIIPFNCCAMHPLESRFQQQFTFGAFASKTAKSSASALSAVGVWDLSVRATFKCTTGFWVLRNQILLHALISMISISYLILFTKVINEKNITLCADLPPTPLRVSKKPLSTFKSVGEPYFKKSYSEYHITRFLWFGGNFYENIFRQHFKLRHFWTSKNTLLSYKKSSLWLKDKFWIF